MFAGILLQPLRSALKNLYGKPLKNNFAKTFTCAYLFILSYSFINHSMIPPLTPPPLSAGDEEGWTSYQIFKKGGQLDRTWIFIVKLVGKWGWLQFSHKLKYDLMIKLVCKQKFFSVITKNWNWEFLTTNLVTFKR